MAKRKAPEWAKKRLSAREEVEARSALQKGEYKRVDVEACSPNPWNPNRLTSAATAKLTKGIKELYTKTGFIPPIVVRPHPEKSGVYQIIDGEHRWKIFAKEHFADTIDALVIDVPDELAKRLTLNLNYLRGEPDEKMEADILVSLAKDGWSPEKLAEVLYKDEESISDLVTAYGDSDVISKLLKDEEDERPPEGSEEKKAKKNDETVDNDVFVDLKFKLSVAQAKVVEDEITRISETLTGKNARGRAIEIMAVNSSHEKLD